MRVNPSRGTVTGRIWVPTEITDLEDAERGEVDEAGQLEVFKRVLHP